MWLEFFRFDLRYHLRQPLFWIAAAVLAALGFITASSASMRVGGSIGNLHLNAPVVIANQLGFLSLIAMFLVAVFIAGAILRDSDAGMADLLFATPASKLDYLAGRFLAGFGVCLAVFALVTLAMMFGSRMPSIDSERIGVFTLYPYAWAFAVLVVPNLLFVASLLLLLAALTRSLVMVYAGVLGFTVLWAMAATLSSGGNGESLGVLLDPFGVRALAQMTRYYSSAQANTEIPRLAGVLLLNRVLWTGIAICLFALTVACFKTGRTDAAKRRFGMRAAPVAMAALPVTAPAALMPRFAPRFDRAALAAQWWQVLRFETRGVLRGLPFLILLALALANFIANYTIGGMRFDSVPYPLTRVILEELGGSINTVLVLVLIFYSGELVFRDRQVNIADIGDALPLPDWLLFSARLGALSAVIFAFLGAGTTTGIAIQLVKGGAPIEAGLYLKGLMLNAAYFVIMAPALLALHMLAGNKYLGYLLGVALLMNGAVLAGFGIEHPLLRFAALPELSYSDMNGYGHFLAGWRWFALYWMLGALALLVLAQAARTRGRDDGWRARLRQASRRLRGRAGAALALCLVGWAGCGAWIFYNTNVLNQTLSAEAELDLRADYEQRYRRFLALPNPSLTSVRAEVDIFPQQRRVAIHGHYVVRNTTAQPMRTLRFQLDPRAATTLLALPPHTVTLDDARHGMRVVELRQALAPGASLAFSFTADVRHQGFTAHGKPDGINHNGTMFTSEDYFPKLGYVQANQISDRIERRKRGLGEAQRMPALDDPAARASNFWKLFGFDTGLIDFETIISTSADQTAIAPGRLERSWEHDGRRWFHYKMDKQILPFFSFQSARYQLRKAHWRGVPIEVYHDPKHPWNVDTMINGSRRALDYFTEHFGPYPHQALRITEFPLYLAYARSFPNTIPFSESLGFVNDLRGAGKDGDDVDHVFYVTAHEVAHQWWGEQLIPANAQGSAMLVESLAEYSALMVLEKEFGAEETRRILRFDLDQYFSGRGKELLEEQPLFKVEDGLYIPYRKGSLVFYRLSKELGEATLNAVLRDFLERHRYQQAPYVTSRDLLVAIRAAAPPEKQDLITDLFERIVFYDNRMRAASAVRRADGKWDVTMTLQLAKIEADGKGRETARAYDEPVDLALFGAAVGGKERVLWRSGRKLAAGESTLTVTVNEKPLEAGVDPWHLLIDRDTGDNRKAVSLP